MIISVIQLIAVTIVITVLIHYKSMTLYGMGRGVVALIPAVLSIDFHGLLSNFLLPLMRT